MIENINIKNNIDSTEVVTVTGFTSEAGTKFSTTTTFPFDIAINATSIKPIEFDDTTNTGGFSEVLTIVAVGKVSGDDVSQTITLQAVDANVVIPDTVPSAVTGLSATSTSTQVDLTWLAPSDGGSAITGYDVYQDGAFIANTPTVNYTVTGLTNDVSYAFKVVAVNSIGDSLDSNTVNITPTLATTAPLGITTLAGTTGDTETVLSWIAPSDGNATITGYNVYQDTVLVGSLVAGSPQTITGLTNDTAYDFDVRAVNSVGEALSSNIISITPIAPVGGTYGTFGDARTEVKLNLEGDATDSVTNTILPSTGVSHSSINGPLGTGFATFASGVSNIDTGYTPTTDSDFAISTYFRFNGASAFEYITGDNDTFYAGTGSNNFSITILGNNYSTDGALDFDAVYGDNAYRNMTISIDSTAKSVKMWIEGVLLIDDTFTGTGLFNGGDSGNIAVGGSGVPSAYNWNGNQLGRTEIFNTPITDAEAVILNSQVAYV